MSDVSSEYAAIEYLLEEDVRTARDDLLERAGLTVEEFRTMTSAACHAKCACPKGFPRGWWLYLTFLDDALRDSGTARGGQP